VDDDKNIMINQNGLAHPTPRVLFVSSEVFPLAKTGGLADVAGALPAVLSRLGADVRVMLPGYPQALDLARQLDIGCDLPEGRLLAGCMPDSDTPVILFDAPALEAAGFVVRNGPVTGQDRWEEDGGYSPFILAVEIAVEADYRETTS
jgi:hypothetical protein